ncbi:AraC family transcriptional regulator [Desertivirga arenae]|uniref:AraC family transcriptional regulator n=1 Tax=Desertivirga arenae TaxID=2810309 RepID=UPI001A9617A9|nr:AraC family transcriptional regulator [Pedobacter sp. SYSU D00823]
MKVLPFTIPVPFDRTVIIQDEKLPYFYSHLHRHEEIQVTWVQEGEGTLIAGNNMHMFNSGEIFLLGANLPHLFKSDPSYFELNSQKNIHATTIFFNPRGKLNSLFDLPEMKNITSFLGKFQNGFKVPAQTVSRVSTSISSMLKTDGIEQFMIFLNLLKEMSGTQDLEPLAVNSYPKSINDSEGMRIANIYNYIMQNYNKPLTLEDVADQAFMTPHAFCRYFKKHTRHTLVTFLNKVRVNEACKMLTSGNFSGISEVAYTCGFNSITNFNRVFKSTTGLSPRSYTDQYVN